MPLRLLDAVTIGQIAAGEIIERPASVVKELVENAVDAGAARITVAIEGGGATLIEVTDDGSGIASDELPLALQRHATSKLATASDLSSIATLGFRGEGLASIGAVAELEVISRTAGAAHGARVSAHGETVGAVTPAAAAPGTRVRVQRLFDNVPVRRDYLRSPQAEFNRISSWLASFTLAYPHIAFTLRHDRKNVWVMPGSDEPRERLAMVFGRQAAAAMLPLDDAAAATIDGSVRGFISAPGSDRPDRRMQLLFVNGRLVRSTLMSGAWSAGYATFTMTGRYPYGVVFVELPPDHVDANVHPAKSDVRLRFGSQVFDAVRRAMTATLNAHAVQRAQANADGLRGAGISPGPVSTDWNVPAASLFERAAGDAEDVPGRRLRVLGQLARTYVVASDGDALLLVDQHAAHERIAYERIAEGARNGSPHEPLLVPLVIDLDAERSAVLDANVDALREGGLEIESFGERTYRITATPAGYGARPFDIDGFVDDLTRDPKRKSTRERIWASLACHSVTVAGERLEPDEMTVLVDRLQQCTNPMHCPHGRPTMVRWGSEDVARMFKRG